MTALLGAFLGVTAALGVWIAVVGATGVRVDENRPPLTIDWSVLWSRGGIAAGTALVVWVLTGWPMAGVAAAAMALVVPVLLMARRDREQSLERIDALAAWAEMLRDTIASHAGLHQAIAVTASVAPEPIRAEVRALARRAERVPLSRALRSFAADVGDPLADLIVAALVIADERQAQQLTDLLSDVARSAREHSAMRLRIETGRARTYASSQALVGITFGLAVVLIAFSPEFLDPYDTFAGQVVLGIIGALFAGAMWGLVKLGRPVEAPRLLAGVEGSAA